MWLRYFTKSDEQPVSVNVIDLRRMMVSGEGILSGPNSTRKGSSLGAVRKDVLSGEGDNASPAGIPVRLVASRDDVGGKGHHQGEDVGEAEPARGHLSLLSGQTDNGAYQVIGGQGEQELFLQRGN
jgi:hypothetical protein